MASSPLNFEDFILTGLFYWIPVIVLLVIFLAASSRFRATWSLNRFWILLAPGFFYALLESTAQRQNWNFFAVDGLLVLGAMFILILHIPNCQIQPAGSFFTLFCCGHTLVDDSARFLKAVLIFGKTHR